jgi:hypothetical protein
MSKNSLIRLNILQNKEDFSLNPIKQQAPIFKLRFIKKVLNPPNNNPKSITSYRIVTISCLFKGYK